NNFSSYYPNLFGIPKGYQVKFKIKKDERYVSKYELESSEWIANNSGKEAEEAKQLTHDFNGEYRNKEYCDTATAYLGHHNAKCSIKRKGVFSKENLSFPIFVK